MELFLSSAELVFLTGYKKKSLQIRHLASNEIFFRINSLGQPVVARASVLEIPKNEVRTKRRCELNLPKKNTPEATSHGTK